MTVSKIAIRLKQLFVSIYIKKKKEILVSFFTNCCKYTVLCNILNPPLINLCFSSKEPDFVVFFKNASSASF